jgi:L-threonylcarbamoyladenylate synthase
MLRPGAVPREEIERIAGKLLIPTEEDGKPQSPGRLLRHYAPAARLRLNATHQRPGELYLAFGIPPAGVDSLQLSLSGNLREAAANLFAMLREADKRGARALAVAPVPLEGLAAS